MLFAKKMTPNKEVINEPAVKLKVDPLTIDELEQAIEKRISIIKKEFSDGFKFIKKYPKSVTFFGSARLIPENVHYQKAVELAELLAKERYAVVSGGGPGIMQAANEGAKRGGGHSLGLTIDLPHEQVTNPNLTDHVGFYYFFVRKVCLAFSAEAFVYFPGGFGTLDEFFEILTLVQTKKIPQVPIILVGADFWAPLKEFMKKNMYDDHRSIDFDDLELFQIMDDPVEIVELIKRHPVRIG